MPETDIANRAMPSAARRSTQAIAVVAIYI